MQKFSLIASTTIQNLLKIEKNWLETDRSFPPWRSAPLAPPYLLLFSWLFHRPSSRLGFTRFDGISPLKEIH
jgi:hypothetical protein